MPASRYTMQIKVETFKGKDGWRWRLRSRQNGEILATSEAYTRKATCRAIAARVCRATLMRGFK